MSIQCTNQPGPFVKALARALDIDISGLKELRVDYRCGQLTKIFIERFTVEEVKECHLTQSPLTMEALAKMLGIASAGTLIELGIRCSLDGPTKVRTERMITDHEAKDAAYSIETFMLAKNNCQQSRQSGGLIPPGQAYIV